LIWAVDVTPPDHQTRLVHRSDAADAAAGRRREGVTSSRRAAEKRLRPPKNAYQAVAQPENTYGQTASSPRCYQN
jgi:hypothetical protein